MPAIPRVSLAWIALPAALAVYFAFVAQAQRHRATVAEARAEQAGRPLRLRPPTASSAAVWSPAERTSTDGTREPPPTLYNLSDLVAAHPEFAAIRSAQLRRTALQAYGERLLLMHLPPDQLEKVKSLLVERRAAEADASEASEAVGIQPGSADFYAAVQNSDKANDQQLAALLGPDRASSLVDPRNYLLSIESYKASLLDAGLTLSGEQWAQLSQLMVHVSDQPGPNGQPLPFYAPPDPQSGNTAFNASVLAQAANFLTPMQLAALESAQKLEVAVLKMHSALSEALPPNSEIRNN